MSDKQTYSDMISSQEGRLIIGQTLMLLSAISLPFAFMIHLALLIVSALLLTFGIKLYFDAKEFLKKARERFLHDEVAPRLKKEVNIDFYPDEGLPADFFEGSKSLEIDQAYESFQRFEMNRETFQIKGAFVRTGPRAKKFQTYQDDALFEGKVVHIVFDRLFKNPVTLSEQPGENAYPMGPLYAHGQKAGQFVSMGEHAKEVFSTFSRKHGGDLKIIMKENHLYLFLKDHRPFIDLSPAKPIGEPPIRFFKSFTENVTTLAEVLRSDDQVMRD